MDQKLSRDQLQQLLNRINEKFQSDDLEAKKNNLPTAERDAMRAQRTDMENKVKAKYGDDLQKLDAGKEINMGKATVSPGVNQSKLVDMASSPGLGKQGMFKKTLGSMGKKVAGVIPFAGAGLAALNGDPAMAAEETGQDIMGVAPAIAAKAGSKLGLAGLAGPAGLAAALGSEAIGSEGLGNQEEEKQMLAERNAMQNYKSSPAGQDAKLAKLKALLGK